MDFNQFILSKRRLIIISLINIYFLKKHIFLYIYICFLEIIILSRLKFIISNKSIILSLLLYIIPYTNITIHKYLLCQLLYTLYILPSIYIPYIRPFYNTLYITIYTYTYILTIIIYTPMHYPAIYTHILLPYIFIYYIYIYVCYICVLYIHTIYHTLLYYYMILLIKNIFLRVKINKLFFIQNKIFKRYCDAIR